MLKDKIFSARKSNTFTLQWHITNDCTNHCKHCYDRSNRGRPGLIEVAYIIDELILFCKSYDVSPQISLSGGDPLCHPDFFEILKLISERKIAYSILGNPCDPLLLNKIIAIQRPLYYQVSLEGLDKYNDQIRGKNNFKKTLEFLDVAQKLGINTHVMLTLSSDNIQDTIPLAIDLQEKAMSFTFNRISLTGEATKLQLPDKKLFIKLLYEYLELAECYPIMSFKDNLFNIIRYKENKTLFPGCTGFGCGAAFNFVALLPDGELHACRKFPSLLGNIYTSSLKKIYNSEIASAYRRRPVNCRKCPIQKNCGGCLASSYSCGLDIFTERDPFCFIDG